MQCTDPEDSKDQEIFLTKEVNMGKIEDVLGLSHEL